MRLRRWWSIQWSVLILVLAAANQVSAQAEQLGPLTTDISGFGKPLPAVAANPADRALFSAGQRLFSTPLSIPVLGPLFNNRTCVACHFQPAMGGSGEFISEIHTRSDLSGLPVHTFAVDNVMRAGPQTQGDNVIFGHGLAAVPLGCQISDPNCRRSRCQQQEARLKNFTTDLPICDPSSPQPVRPGAGRSDRQQCSDCVGQLGATSYTRDGPDVGRARRAARRALWLEG
jgi:hypothetical protein